MSKYAGMSNDRAADEYAYDEGMAQLREEAIDKIASRMFKKAMDEKVMPDGQTVGDFLCAESLFANQLNQIDLKTYSEADSWHPIYLLANVLISKECNQAAEDEVDGN